MSPLNDEWLSWPPESLDGFFTSQAVDEASASVQQNESMSPQPKENVYETLGTKLYD